MKTYRRHYCERTHRTYRTTAKCLWPRAYWITGDGPYATLAWCRVLTIELHDDWPTAVSAMRVMGGTGCGGACGNRHEMVYLCFEHLASRRV